MTPTASDINLAGTLQIRLEDLMHLFEEFHAQGGLQQELGLSFHDFIKNTWSRMNVASACRVTGPKAKGLIEEGKLEEAQGNPR
jgi:hypothetical protein